MLHPFSFFVRSYTLPDLFAGKIHALLYRNWKNRVKGRDWFDFEWYVKNGIKINLHHFVQRAFQSNLLVSNSFSATEFKHCLKRG